MNGEPVHHPVSIVGTGPGDPDLLTVRAARIIGNAEVILYDCPTVEPALCIASPSATVRFIERVRHDGPSGQAGSSRMLRLMREFFYEGLRVVRLRAGDPLLFGSPEDECLALGSMHIPFEVVPGLSAGAAAAAGYAMPVSEKYQSDSVTSLIANEITDDFALVRDAAKLIRHGSTIVLYMATRNLSGIFRVFAEEGVPSCVPVVAVARSGWPDEACGLATMGDIAGLLASGKLRDPVVYFIGRHLGVRNSPEGVLPPGVLVSNGFIR